MTLGTGSIRSLKMTEKVSIRRLKTGVPGLDNSVGRRLAGILF